MTEKSPALYIVVKNHILDLIASGTLKVGDMIPSENQLAQEMTISRMTVNRAFKELEREGHILRKAGLGSFVAEKRVHGEALNIIGIRNEIEKRGEIWTTKILQSEVVKLSVAMALEMELSTGAKAYRLRAVHYGNGIPIELEDRLVNVDLIPSITQMDFTQRACSDYLIDIAPFLKAEHQIQAIPAQKEEVLHLDVARGDACLQIKRRTWTGAKVASVARLTYAGDRYHITAQFDHR